MKRCAAYIVYIAVLSFAIKAQPQTATSECPTITVNCPTKLLPADAPKIFRANIVGGNPNLKPTYTWTMAGGQIVSGQGTSEIKVILIQNKALTATIEVGGLAAVCPGKASCTQIIEPPVPSTKFDEFGDVSYEDAAARMDNFAAQLQNQPGSQGCIIAYAGRHDLPGVSSRYALRLKNYILFNPRGIQADRIVAIDGGRRENTEVEVWIVPPGSVPPVPKPTITLQPNKDHVARLFDEYTYYRATDEDFEAWDGRYEDEPSRLDSFAAALKNEPSSRAYIVVSMQAVYQYRLIKPTPGNRKRRYVLIRSLRFSDPVGSDNKIAESEKRYLITKHHLDSARILAIGVGYTQLPNTYSRVKSTPGAIENKTFMARSVKLWIVPLGAIPPKTTTLPKGK